MKTIRVRSYSSRHMRTKHAFCTSKMWVTASDTPTLATDFTWVIALYFVRQTPWEFWRFKLRRNKWHFKTDFQVYVLIWMLTLEFFLNVFIEFSDKDICHYSKRTQTCHLLCKRPGCYHSASKIHVRDRIFKLSPIHASLIYQIHWIQWKFCSI